MADLHESARKVLAGVDTDSLRPPAVMPARRRPLTLDDYTEGVLAGDRVIVGRALSLVESVAERHRSLAGQLLDRLAHYSGKSIRVGVSGVPGVGKSTFIEAFGMEAIETSNARVAVLAIDPSSEVSGGSILGDKTRMDRLAGHENAMVRPTATGSWLGGVARASRESIMVCEAAGFDLIIVETVGVGQSETQVASMVDFFLLLMLAGAGDELQGIKRGILEVADAVVVNKADGNNEAAANVARAQLASALRLLRHPSEGWTPRVQTCSALKGIGIAPLWEMVREHHEWAMETGVLAERRRKQALYWMTQSLDHMLKERFEQQPAVARSIEAIRRQVLEGTLSPFAAAERLVHLAFDGNTDTV